MTQEPLLSVSGLTKRFGGVTAVDSVDFELKENELVGVIGPNGSGKTTLVNLITGFVKPDRGTIVYQGKDITGMSPHKIAEEGIVRAFQMVRPFYQLPAFKNLIVPLYSPRVRKLAGGKYGDRSAVAKDILEEVGFERDSAVINKVARVLPHGYLKRMELGKCIAMRADLIILDELFSGSEPGRGGVDSAHHREAQGGRKDDHHDRTPAAGAFPHRGPGHRAQLRAEDRRGSAQGRHGERRGEEGLSRDRDGRIGSCWKFAT